MTSFGFVVYEDMTTLDFLGVYDAVTRLETMEFEDDLNIDLEWDVCARPGSDNNVKDITGLGISVTATPHNLGDYDAVTFPGGVKTRELVDDEDFVSWVKTSMGANLRASVCTGSLLLGAAGLLEDKTATTHPSAFDALSEYCEVSEERVVDEGNVVTARGVTSSIDLGLHLCEKLSNKDTARQIAEQMDYPQYRD